MSAVQAIKVFFEKDGGRKIEMSELKELAPEQRAEVGALCCAALGVELK